MGFLELIFGDGQFGLGLPFFGLSVGGELGWEAHVDFDRLEFFAVVVAACLLDETAEHDPLVGVSLPDHDCLLELLVVFFVFSFFLDLLSKSTASLSLSFPLPVSL